VRRREGKAGQKPIVGERRGKRKRGGRGPAGKGEPPKSRRGNNLLQAAKSLREPGLKAG